MKRESKSSGINLIPEKSITVFRRGDERVWELTAPDADRIRCQCGSFAVYGRTVNGSAPFFYECRECLPSQYLTPASPTAIGGKRLAVLTPEENKAWMLFFTALLEDGLTDDQADAATWLELQERFPRLKDFDGCKP